MGLLGVTIGKFYPPHRGHKHLIDFGLAHADQLAVIVCEHPSQRISGELRRHWLQEVHPAARVLVTPDDLPEVPEPWAARTLELLGGPPDLVFTSEDYGKPYAEAMGARHISVDAGRVAVPISATEIRKSVVDHLDFLEPCVRAHFVKRVVLIGVESTGKTTLTQQLAEHFATGWVHEFGREYAAAKTNAWTTSDFVTIATEQQRLEQLAARSANRVLVCDTNAVATSVWHRRYMGTFSDEVEWIANGDRADLYLLALPDFPFVQDGTRDGEHIRHSMHQWFEDRLAQSKCPVVRIAGSKEDRFLRAVAAIQETLSIPFEF